MLTKAECEAALDAAKKWPKGLNRECWMVPIPGLIPTMVSTSTPKTERLLTQQPHLAEPYG